MAPDMTKVNHSLLLPGIASILLGFFYTILSGQVTAQPAEIAGRVISASGEVTAIEEQLTTYRRVTRRSEIYVRDTIRTSDQSRVQIRMLDSAILSLGCESSLKIEAYDYEESAANDQLALRLLSGRFRTITGAIGEQNPQRYRFLVGDITIQILGTDYEVNYDPQTRIAYVGVYDGSVRITNPQGSISLGIGGNADFARIEPGMKPEEMLNQPTQLGSTAATGSQNPVAISQPGLC